MDLTEVCDTITSRRNNALIFFLNIMVIFWGSYAYGVRSRDPCNHVLLVSSLALKFRFSLISRFPAVFLNVTDVYGKYIKTTTV